MGRKRLMASDDVTGEEITVPPTPGSASRGDRNGAYGRASALEIVLAAFGVIGASVGIAIRERTLETLLLAIPTLVGGLLIVLVGGLLWRAFCEFYVVIFRIGDDLAALRRVAEDEQGGPPRA